MFVHIIYLKRKASKQKVGGRRVKVEKERKDYLWGKASRQAVTAEGSLLASIHCEIQESMTSELSISKHTHTRAHIQTNSDTYTHQNSRIPATSNLQCPANASEREDCSRLGSDQGVFPAFPKMDSDFFTFQLFNKTVCPLCAAKRMKAGSQQPSLCSKMSFFNSKVKNNIFWQKKKKRKD